MKEHYLFRGKRVDNGEWIEGYYVHDQILGHRILGYSNHYFKVHPESIGQYTGLTDKNGTKIFEGDVVNCHPNKCPHTVVFVQQMGGTYGGGMPGFNLSGLQIDCGKGYAWTGHEEIIGNLTDNPELLNA